MTTATTQATARRHELAAFLRSRRERIRPEDAGLPWGQRRRTSGLRREEVAQLAGVGVTWYTWLEQGRPINVSSQVLDAVARTLRLDPVERTHLFRLAGMAGHDHLADCPDCPLPAEVQRVLDAFGYAPAYVVNERFDLLAWNGPFAAVFRRLASAPPVERNMLLANLTDPACCNPCGDPEVVCESMIGMLRAAYGNHVGDPAWTHFIQRLEAASPAFARIWAAHDVATPGHVAKTIRHPGVGLVNVATTSFAVHAVPGARMVVYTPCDEPSREALTELAAGKYRDVKPACWHTHRAARAAAAAAEAALTADKATLTADEATLTASPA